MLWRSTNASNNRGHITFLIYKSDDEFISWLASYIKEAAERAGYKIAILDSRNSQAFQVMQVQNAYLKGERAIIINLVAPEEAPQVLQSAENMKVVFVNRAPDRKMLNQNAVYIGSDERAAGKMQGEWLANYFKERGKKAFRYILLQGPLNLPSTIERTEAVLQTLADNGITATRVAVPIVANYDRDEAMSQMIRILRSGVEFEVIISNNDAMALGAIEAMEYLNMDPSKKVIVGVDATVPAVRALLEGKLTMTVFQNARAQAIAAIKAADNMLHGRPFDAGTGYPVSEDNPYVIWVPFEIVTRYKIPKDLYF